MLADKGNSGLLDINCCDPLGRSALLMGIDNENLEMVELLLDHKVRQVISVLVEITRWQHCGMVAFQCSMRRKEL